MIMFALILEAFYEQRTSHNVRTLWGALEQTQLLHLQKLLQQLQQLHLQLQKLVLKQLQRQLHHHPLLSNAPQGGGTSGPSNVP